MFFKNISISPYLFILNAFIAFLIFLNAEFGRQLGIQELPLAISLVWPATGFSLAALLIFGIQTWPAVILGNFAYNYLHFYMDHHTFFLPLFLAFIISLGSTLQAVVGYAIMRKYCQPKYFSSVKNVFVFLIPAGLLTCLIASTIGTICLGLYTEMSWQTAFFTWLIFWIGDTMGVYVFTPLLVVWGKVKKLTAFKKNPKEIILIIVSFIFITLLVMFVEHYLYLLYLPFTIWVTYRYRFRGATLSVFFVTLVIIIPLTRGVGPFPIQGIASLFELVIFLEIIVATSLILAAVVSERLIAMLELENYNLNLEEALEWHKGQLYQKEKKIHYHEKLTALGLLISGIARRIQKPLEEMRALLKSDKEDLDEVTRAIQVENRPDIERRLLAMGDRLVRLEKLGSQSFRIARAIDNQWHLISTYRFKERVVNINTILEECLVRAAKKFHEYFPNFTFSTLEELEKNGDISLAVPDDISHAFYHLVYYSINCLKEKQDQLQDNFNPTLTLSTTTNPDAIEIVIGNNGLGIPKDTEKTFFESLIETTSYEEKKTLFDEMEMISLGLAYDIITHLYSGEIHVKSEEGEYLNFIILLPKT